MSQKKPKKSKNGRYCLYYKGKQFVGKNLDDVKKRRDEYKKQIEGGLSDTETVQTYVTRWLPDNRSHVSDHMFNSYAHLLDFLVNDLGKKRLNQVTPSDIKHIYSTHMSGFSDGYIKRASALYSSLFDSAVEDRLCFSNPCRTKTAKPPKGHASSHNIISQEQREIIHKLQDRMRLFVMVMLYAGLRNGEALALDIDRDIDFKKNEIHVSHFAKSINHNDYIDSTTGKNPNAVRTIKLFPILKTELEGKHGLIAPSKKGGIMTKCEFECAWSAYLRHAEELINGRYFRYYGIRHDDIERKAIHDKLIEEGKTEEAKAYELPEWKTFQIRPYDLRHSFCTYCRDCGVDMHVLQQWMGHTDIKMISSVYDHVTNERIESEYEKIRKMQENSTKNST